MRRPITPQVPQQQKEKVEGVGRWVGATASRHWCCVTDTHTEHSRRRSAQPQHHPDYRPPPLQSPCLACVVPLSLVVELHVLYQPRDPPFPHLREFLPEKSPNAFRPISSCGRQRFRGITNALRAKQAGADASAPSYRQHAGLPPGDVASGHKLTEGGTHATECRLVILK